MNRIEFSHLKIQNFRAISELELEFVPSSIVLIKGRNGSGKSSIFNALYSCLYNRQLNGRPLNKAIKQGTDFCVLNLVFNINGVQHELYRRIGKNSKVILYREGEELASGNKVKSIIESLIPPKILKLHMLQSLQIKDIISDLTDVSEFSQKVSDRKKSVEKELLEKEGQLQADQHHLEFVSKQIHETVQNIEKLDCEIKKFQQQISKLEPSVNNANLVTITEKQKRVEQFMIEYQTSLKTFKDSIQLKIRTEVDEPKIKYSNLLKQLESELVTKKQKLEIEKHKLIKSLEIDINTLQVEIKNTESELQKFRNLLDTKKCFTCDREIKTNDIPKFQQKIEKLQEQLIKSKQKVEEIKRKQIEIQQEYQSKIQKLEEKILKDKQKISDYLQQLENYRNSLLSQIDNNYENNLKIKLLDKFNLTESDLNQDYSRLVSNINQIDQLKAKLQTLILTKENLETQLNKLQKQEEAIKQSIDKIHPEIEKLKEKVKILTTWQNTRLIKKLLVKKATVAINSLIQQKYGQIIKVSLELTESDDINILIRNMNGDIVPLDDSSTGESVISKLTLYIALRYLLSQSCCITCLFLDEFLDSLDELNVEKVLSFLKDISTNEHTSIFLISHRESIQTDIYDDIIDMSEYAGGV